MRLSDLSKVTQPAEAELGSMLSPAFIALTTALACLRDGAAETHTSAILQGVRPKSENHHHLWKGTRMPCVLLFRVLW